MPFSYVWFVGLAAMTGVGVLGVAVAGGRSRLVLALFIGSVALAGMSVTSEHLSPLLAAVLVLTALVQLAARRPRHAATLAAIPLVGLILALIPEGPLAALVRSPARAEFLSLNFDDLFTLPTRWSLSPGEPAIFFSTERASRVGLLDSLMWRERGWVLIALAGSGLVAILRRRPGLATPAAAGLAALLLPGMLHDELYPWNTGRFTAAGLLFAAVSLSVVLTALWRWRGAGRRLARLAAIGLGTMAAGTWLATLGLLPSLVYTPESPVLRDELAATEFAAHLPYPQRALLLPGPQTFAQLNSGIYDGMHKYAVTLGRLQVPMGFDNRGERERYAALYARAQETLALKDLNALGIDLIYTARDHLTAAQRHLLDQALARGTIVPLFESPGGVRAIYGVVTDAGG